MSICHSTHQNKNPLYSAAFWEKKLPGQLNWATLLLSLSAIWSSMKVVMISRSLILSHSESSLNKLTVLKWDLCQDWALPWRAESCLLMSRRKVWRLLLLSSSWSLRSLVELVTGSGMSQDYYTNKFNSLLRWPTSLLPASLWTSRLLI